MENNGNKGRGRRAVSAQIPNIPIMAIVRKAVGILRSCDWAIDLFGT